MEGKGVKQDMEFLEEKNRTFRISSHDKPQETEWQSYQSNHRKRKEPTEGLERDRTTYTPISINKQKEKERQT